MDGYIDIVILIDTHEINSEGDSLMSKNKTVKKKRRRDGWIDGKTDGWIGQRKMRNRHMSGE